ncbi:MAG: GAF domain-containing protein, partial [Pyrinomonadaceae bacterium]|nr:GAF domain-containing protein [Pyrinomonadaceae bacterium]
MATSQPTNELERLNALLDYKILDTLPEAELDDLTLLASRICETPMAMITLVDDKRQWFKSKIGIEVEETPRNIAFCSSTIQGRDLFIVEDAARDERFIENPLVTGEPKIRFYAGAPLITTNGHSIGTLCVIDSKPRELTEEQKKSLAALARGVMTRFELRRSVSVLNDALSSKNSAATKHSKVFDFAEKTAFRRFVR